MSLRPGGDLYKRGFVREGVCGGEFGINFIKKCRYASIIAIIKKKSKKKESARHAV